MDDRQKPVAPQATPAAVHAMELGLSYVLRGGVIVSSAVVVLGLALMFVHHPEFLRRGTSVDEAINKMTFPHTFAEVFIGIGRGEGRAIIIAGLFVLIATPVVRVGVSVAVFFHQRDRLFTVITLVVLILLLTSFLLGRAGG